MAKSLIIPLAPKKIGSCINREAEMVEAYHAISLK